MKRLIYIIAPEYSGSTAVSTLLGGFDGYICCGEITNSINSIKGERVKRSCSCGEELETCEVWSTIQELTDQEADASIDDCYRALDHRLEVIFGPDYGLIDASKRIDTLVELQRIYGDRVRIIFLIRDLRGYLHGRLSKDNLRTQHQTLRLWPLLRWMPSWAIEIGVWLRRVIGIWIGLKKHGIPHLNVGYDDLAQNPQHVIREIASYIGEPNPGQELFNQNPRHHMLHGNKGFMYESDQMTARSRYEFHYDDSWKSVRLPWLCGLIVSFLSPINKRLAYPRRNA